jgi:hypothetical protein
MDFTVILTEARHLLTASQRPLHLVLLGLITADFQVVSVKTKRNALDQNLIPIVTLEIW